MVAFELSLQEVKDSTPDEAPIVRGNGGAIAEERYLRCHLRPSA
jgi:hypothetical protein